MPGSGRADFFRLDPTQALAVVAEVESAVVMWRNVAARHGLSPSEIAAREPAFSSGQAR